MQNNQSELNQERVKENCENWPKDTDLDLSYKEWKIIKANSFESLTALKILYLVENKIEVIESRSFDGLSSLKELNLSANELNQINTQTFKSLVSLEKLCLNKNKIGAIDSEAFEDLKNLKILELAENKLIRINNDSFKWLNSLEKLTLSENQIDEIEPNAFEDLNNLKELYLQKNKLNLSCKLCFECLTWIGLIRLEGNNRLDANILSYFNRKVFDEWRPNHKFDLGLRSYSISEYYKHFSFMPDFNAFLNQFPEISSNFFFNLKPLTNMNNEI